MKPNLFRLEDVLERTMLRVVASVARGFTMQKKCVKFPNVSNVSNYDKVKITICNVKNI